MAVCIKYNKCRYKCLNIKKPLSKLRGYIFMLVGLPSSMSATTAMTVTKTIAATWMTIITITNYYPAGCIVATVYYNRPAAIITTNGVMIYRSPVNYHYAFGLIIYRCRITNIYTNVGAYLGFGRTESY